jgi:hypothetical protein
MVCPERALVVGTGYLNFFLMLYYNDVNERRGIRYTYISLLHNNFFFNKTRRAIVHGIMIGRTWWAERLK